MVAKSDGGGTLTRERLVPYALKSVALVALLFVLSRVLPAMPIWGVALALALLSLVPATGSVYRVVVTRTFNQRKFGEGSVHKSRYLLRVPIFIGFYALSAISVGSILLESPTWVAGMWATVILAVPLYVAVSAAASWFVEKKERAIPLVRDARAARFSVVATGVLLCVVLTAISFLQPAEPYARAADAFMAAQKPFEGSPSALMREVGDLVALVGSLESYALAKLSETSWHVYLVLQVLLNAAAMLGVAGMLSVCLVEPCELKRVFLVLEKDGGRDGARPFVKSFCIAFAALPLLMVVGIASLDAKVQDPAQNEGYTFAKKVVQDQVSLIVYEFDGKYYNGDAVKELLESAKQKSEALAREADATLEPLINASFDARIANVDKYLDWYYSVFSDWDRLLSFLKGNADEYMREQMVAHIEEGIDDTELNEAIKQYMTQCTELKESTMAELSRYEQTEEYLSWLVEEVKPLEEQVSISLEPTEGFLSSCRALDFNEAVGIAVRPMSAALAGLGVDMALKKVDELLNREAYKAEIVAEIEAQREKTLAAVRGALVVDAGSGEGDKP